MLAYLWVAAGAVIGASMRYGIARWGAKLIESGLPYPTLFINASGSFVLGFFMVWTSERVLVDPRWRLFVAVGLCGGYTTFSSYAFESFALFEQGQWLAAGLNILSNNLLALAGVVLGAVLARVL